MDSSRRDFLRTTGIGLAASPTEVRANEQRPNFVIIFLDDSGWSDFRPFGKPDYPTPNVERLATQGCAFHNFYVPQAICSASRSALLCGLLSGQDEGVRRASSARKRIGPEVRDDGRGAEGRGIQDGGVRQMAHRRPA